VDVQQFSENSLNIPVRELAQCAQRFSRTRTGFKLLPYALPFRFDLRTEHGQGSRGSLHVFSGRDARIETGARGGRHLDCPAVTRKQTAQRPKVKS
jgi:hypothetical protein